MDARIAVLVSGSGTNLQALLADPLIRRHIALVLSDRPAIQALERAGDAGVETLVIQPDAFGDRDRFSRAVADELEARDIDLLVSAGYLRILGPDVVKRWQQRFVNVHPALLPAFPGTHGVRDALAYGVKTTGVTVHFVDDGVDSGPIILQEAVDVRDDDSWDTLEERIHEAEHRLLPTAVRALLAGRVTVDGRRVRIEEAR
jgi:phosphoribosylglycinamide formyltransferase 1